MTTGLGDQQAKRSSANLGVYRIELLRLRQKGGRFVERPSLFRRFHQVQQGLAVERQRSVPTLGHVVRGPTIRLLPGPVQPLFERFPMWVHGTSALEEMAW